MIYNLKKYYYGEILERSEEFYNSIKKRRSVKKFSRKKIPFQVIKNCILSANNAPFTSYEKPWHFVIIKDSVVKKKIRIKVEQEDADYYDKLATKEWLKDLELFVYGDKQKDKRNDVFCSTSLYPFLLRNEKPERKDEKRLIIYPDRSFLEEAPYLIVIFATEYFVDQQGKKIYYDSVDEGVGIATGFLITALHQSGLAMLPYILNPTHFLNKICRRTANEKPVFLIAVGSPKEGTKVPEIPPVAFEKIATVL